MATITIKGIRFDEVTVKRDVDGLPKVSATYSLLSSADTVLAKQSVNSYGGLEINPSASTVELLNNFVKAFKVDVHRQLGLDVE